MKNGMICPICGRGFTFEYDYKEHLRFAKVVDNASKEHKASIAAASILLDSEDSFSPFSEMKEKLKCFNKMKKVPENIRSKVSSEVSSYVDKLAAARVSADDAIEKMSKLEMIYAFRKLRNRFTRTEHSVAWSFANEVQESVDADRQSEDSEVVEQTH